ncbi:MAG TPA: hypothetical protein VLG47_01890 [Candidatus Saccharimonadales bacterium]|nr:hypothetical protein [Candidatus Saccharimonadales bacterium]
MPGSVDDLTQSQVDAEFAAMMGIDQESLGNTESLGALHADLGATAMGPEVMVISLADDQDRLAAEFMEELDASAFSMTPQELAEYHAHVDNTLNPRLVELGFNAVDTNEAERRENMMNALIHADAILASRRAYDEGLAIQAEHDDEKSEATPRRKTSSTYPSTVRKNSRPNSPANRGRKSGALRTRSSTKQLS